MRAASSTIVCVAGERDAIASVLAKLDGVPNAAVVRGGPPDPATPADIAPFLREVRSLYDQAGARQTPYAVVEADPLAPVRDAWFRRFGPGPDVLEESAGAAAPASIELPDYYLVLHAPAADLELEWYAGLLRDTRPSRVVVVPTDAPPDVVARRAADTLGALPTGPLWPPARELIEAARRFVPATRDTLAVPWKRAPPPPSRFGHEVIP